MSGYFGVCAVCEFFVSSVRLADVHARGDGVSIVWRSRLEPHKVEADPQACDKSGSAKKLSRNIAVTGVPEFKFSENLEEYCSKSQKQEYKSIIAQGSCSKMNDQSQSLIFQSYSPGA